MSFLDLLEIETEKDNAIAREKMKRVITEFREDDGAFWRVDDITTLKLFEYAGYTERDDLGRLYQNLRSMERFNEYKERARKRQIEEKERQKALRKANLANSPLGRLKARVGKFLT